MDLRNLQNGGCCNFFVIFILILTNFIEMTKQEILKVIMSNERFVDDTRIDLMPEDRKEMFLERLQKKCNTEIDLMYALLQKDY